MMQVEEFYELLESVDESSSIDALKETCERFCLLIDIPYYLLGVIGQTSSYSPTIRVISNYPEKWLELYFKESEQQNDPVVKYIFEKQSPIRWDKLVEYQDFSSSKGLLVFEKAAAYGLYNGLSIPIRSTSENIAVFSVAIGERADANKVLDNAQMFCHTFATHLFERYVLLEISASEETDRRELTKRELECLFWACEGKTAWEISQIINVSERTVLFHLGNSNTKLGAINRQHAVALAIKKGIIKPNI
jgi:LuxR family transcriptional activator of bioluminescence operon